MSSLAPCHLVFPVDDLAAARRCHGTVLGCPGGPGQVGEQATMFFHDPAGNALEFKSFRDRSQLFAK